MKRLQGVRALWGGNALLLSNRRVAGWFAHTFFSFSFSAAKM